MNKVTLKVQDYTGRNNFTSDWNLPRTDKHSYETEMSGEDAADEAFRITNCPWLSEDEISKLGSYRGPSLSVGDVVQIESEDGTTEQYLVCGCGWESRKV